MKQLYVLSTLLWWGPVVTSFTPLSIGKTRPSGSTRIVGTTLRLAGIDDDDFSTKAPIDKANKKKVVVLGGDGFCGWPTSLYLSDQGHDVVIVDNLSRRNIDIELGCDSLTPIQSPEVRVATSY
jgi:hypothetical protein